VIYIALKSLRWESGCNVAS